MEMGSADLHQPPSVVQRSHGPSPFSLLLSEPRKPALTDFFRTIDPTQKAWCFGMFYKRMPQKGERR